MNWNQFVVDYKNKHGISFKEALTKAGPEWRKMKGTTSQTVKKSRSKKSRIGKKYVCKKISKKSKGHKKGKESPWIAFVKKYAKDHKIEFKDAMKPAGKAWKSQKGQKGGGTHVTSAGEGGSVVSSTSTSTPEGSEDKKPAHSAPAHSATATNSEPTGGTPTTEPFAMFGGKKKSKKHRKKKRRGNKSKKH